MMPQKKGQKGGQGRQPLPKGTQGPQDELRQQAKIALVRRQALTIVPHPPILSFGGISVTLDRPDPPDLKVLVNTVVQAASSGWQNRLNSSGERVFYNALIGGQVSITLGNTSLKVSRVSSAEEKVFFRELIAGQASLVLGEESLKLERLNPAEAKAFFHALDAFRAEGPSITCTLGGSPFIAKGLDELADQMMKWKAYAFLEDPFGKDVQQFKDLVAGAARLDTRGVAFPQLYNLPKIEIAEVPYHSIYERGVLARVSAHFLREQSVPNKDECSRIILGAVQEGLGWPDGDTLRYEVTDWLIKPDDPKIIVEVIGALDDDQQAAILRLWCSGYFFQLGEYQFVAT